MKLFEMIRNADESNFSGTGKVLEGVVFADGVTVVRWCVEGKPKSTVVYASFSDFETIHITSHPTNGTEVNWLAEVGLIYEKNQSESYEQ